MCISLPEVIENLIYSFIFMKNFIKPTFILVIAYSVLSTSCQYEEKLIPESSPTVTSTEMRTSAELSSSDMLVVEANKRWYKEVLETANAYATWTDIFCKELGNGCATPDTIDTLFSPDSIPQILAAISGGSGAIGTLFSNNLAYWVQSLSPQQMASIQSGTYFMNVIHNGSDYFAVFVGTTFNVDETTAEFSIRWNL